MTENKWLSVFTNQYQSAAASPGPDIWVSAVIRNIAKTTTSCQFSSRSNHQTARKRKLKSKHKDGVKWSGCYQLTLGLIYQTTPGRRMGLTISACVWFLIDPLRLPPSGLLITDHSLTRLHKMMETHIREITRILTGEILDGWWISDDQDTRRTENYRFYNSFMIRG